MDQPILRLLIQEKLADGRLSHDRNPRVLGGLGKGEPCDGCGETVTIAQMGMEGYDASECPVQFHVACFYVWETERQVASRAPGGRLPARSTLNGVGARPTRSWALTAPPARPTSPPSP